MPVNAATSGNKESGRDWEQYSVKATVFAPSDTVTEALCTNEF